MNEIMCCYYKKCYEIEELDAWIANNSSSSILIHMSGNLMQTRKHEEEEEDRFKTVAGSRTLKM